MKNKIYLFVILSLLISCFLIGCSNALSEHTPDDCPEVFVAGQQDALDKITWEAKYGKCYVDVEELIDVLEREYGGDVAYEIRDSLNLYETSDIVNDLIDAYYWE